MAMVGSVITRDMEYNQIYAGTPAKSISDKLGFQFNDVSVDEKYEKMLKHLKDFGGSTEIEIIRNNNEMRNPEKITYFNVTDRTYNKRLAVDEVRIMTLLLPEKGKFIPLDRI